MVSGESSKRLTPNDIASKYGVDVKKVHFWIERGELGALNLAARPDGRPRYVILPDDLARFEQARRVVPKADQRPARRRRRSSVVAAEAPY